MLREKNVHSKLRRLVREDSEGWRGEKEGSEEERGRIKGGKRKANKPGTEGKHRCPTGRKERAGLL